MSDRATAGRGGTADKLPAAQRLTTPAWSKEAERGKGAASSKLTTVKRYFAGQAPAWEQEEEAPEAAAAAAAPPAAPRVPVPPVVVLPPSVAAPREVAPPQLVRPSAPEPAVADEEAELSDDEIDRRRAVARARAVALRAAEAPELQGDLEGGGDEEDEGESEWETDSDAEEAAAKGRLLLKPVFVPKAERESLVERAAAEREAAAHAVAEAAAAAARIAASRAAAAELVQRDTAVAAATAAAEASDVDTDDEAHEAEEYAAWAAREMARLASDRAAREAAFKERSELEALRAMSEEERAAWDAAHPRPPDAAAAAREKEKWVFLQKYYHKGAFFQHAADDRFESAGTHEIYGRSFSAATGEDRGADKATLPKAMQKRKETFGRAGQTKWTHLTAEDTGTRDALWGARPAPGGGELAKPRHLPR